MLMNDFLQPDDFAAIVKDKSFVSYIAAMRDGKPELDNDAVLVLIKSRRLLERSRNFDVDWRQFIEEHVIDFMLNQVLRL